MEGKRKSYVNPFSLYIFISFIAFLIPFLLPDPPEVTEEESVIGKNIVITKNAGDTIKLKDKDEQPLSQQLDSIYRNSNPEKQYISTDGFVYKTALNIADNLEDDKKQEKALDFFLNNIPKALFVYMPIFAFMLWLFHNKKRFYYFDSGIFTLHFFSVVLLSFTIGSIIACIADWLEWDWLWALTWIFFPTYITFYFFRGSRVFYAEKRWVSNIKSFFQMIINFVLILLVIILYGVFTIYKIYG